tara:strand:- start:971 stop:2212 length:1242 start_codon:yes stop_codon:yes gene_type:complete
MKKSLNLKETRSELVSKLEGLHTLATSEKRELTKDEASNVDTYISKIDTLDIDITRAEKIETELRNAAALSGKSVVSSNVSKEIRNWSLFKAVRDIQSTGKLAGLEAEMHQEAEKEARKGLQGIGMPSFMTEKRAIDQTNSAIAPVSVGAFVDSLQEAGLWNRVGLQNLGTVAADTVLPIAGGSTVGWQTEVGVAANGGADFGKLTLTPKRLTGFANLSNVILAQNGTAAEASVMNDMGRNMATQIDAAMFGSANVANAPNSIAATANVLTFTESAVAAGAGLTADMLEAIQTIANNHGLDGRLAFVNSWSMYTLLKSQAQVAGVFPSYVDDKLLGYDGYFSSAPATTAGGAPTADGLFGDFSRVYLAQFGPSNILVDPYSRATNNEVRLVMNNHFDWGVASGASFVKYTSLV